MSDPHLGPTTETQAGSRRFPPVMLKIPPWAFPSLFGFVAQLLDLCHAVVARAEQTR